jgi:hypothetical protein
MSEHLLPTIGEADYRQRVIADLAEIKANMRTLLGNGQPGVIAEMKADIRNVAEQAARARSEIRAEVKRIWEQIDRVGARVWLILGAGIVLGFIGLEGFQKLFR